VRILLDTGILIDAEFAEPAVKSSTERWGGIVPLPAAHGLKRKVPKKQQDHIDALFTVGRLIRENAVEAYDYLEVNCEFRRGAPGISAFNALRCCEIHRCCPAIDRSKFRKTTDIIDFFSKGGKKDIKKGVALGQANQLSFLGLLYTLRKKDVETLISLAEELQLSAFELDSLRDIEWFQFLCERSGSAENYPDVFHLAARGACSGFPARRAT
jgi:hypothetical protein